MYSTFVDHPNRTHAARTKPVDDVDSRITAALAYIDRHYGGQLSIHDLASMVGLSPSRFAHLFKEITGFSIMKYLKLVRLEAAKRLLAETNDGIKSVAAAVNLPDRSHFVRDFRKVHGVSPTRYRLAAVSRRMAEMAAK